MGVFFSDSSYFKDASEKHKLATVHKKDFAEAYFGQSWAMINFHRYTNSIPDNNLIFDNLIKAYLLSISQKQWQLANIIAGKYFLHDDIPDVKDTNFYHVVFFFDIALKMLSNPENLSATEFEKLKEARSINENEAVMIVIDAILESKKPDPELDHTDDELVLNAAIVLANEIVNTFPKLG